MSHQTSWCRHCGDPIVRSGTSGDWYHPTTVGGQAKRVALIRPSVWCSQAADSPRAEEQ